MISPFERAIARPEHSATLRPLHDLRIDFFRGLALIFIFIDHIPGNKLAQLTPRNFGLSDASELFVLLSGFSAALAYASAFHGDAWKAGLARIGSRIAELYAAYLLLLGVCLRSRARGAAQDATPAFKARFSRLHGTFRGVCREPESNGGMLEPTHIRVIGPAGRRRQAVPIRWEDMRLVDKAALDELQAMGSDGPYGDAFDLLSELTVTEPPSPALAQRTVDEDFV